MTFLGHMIHDNGTAIYLRPRVPKVNLLQLNVASTTCGSFQDALSSPSLLPRTTLYELSQCALGFPTEDLSKCLTGAMIVTAVSPPTKASETIAVHKAIAPGEVFVAASATRYFNLSKASIVTPGTSTRSARVVGGASGRPGRTRSTSGDVRLGLVGYSNCIDSTPRCARDSAMVEFKLVHA